MNLYNTNILHLITLGSLAPATQTTCSFAGNANGSGKGSKLAFL